ncbi:hypothetical protein ACGFIK_08275 [Micromonospora sp. NPDC048871]|uniref:hypothetical protein n=1 Tax=unclassified Micromonospora TaxID=2617518 RepID=UPI002E0F3294|nr:hypothetical protein OIE53_01765 [Micromonospora sp. NBC_01739]
MTPWILVSARDARDSPGLDAAAYNHRVHGLADVVSSAVERGFAGSQWLRKQLPARSFLAIELNLDGGRATRVERLKHRTYPDARELRYKLWVPGAWFSTPGDGLLGIRLLRAVLATVAVVGAERELGPPQLRAAATDPGRPEMRDLFSPPSSEASRFTEAARRLTELVDRADPEQLILSGVEPVTERTQQGRQAVVGRLGAVEDDIVIPVAETERVRVWTLRRIG